jgi:hypothetical protein
MARQAQALHEAVAVFRIADPVSAPQGNFASRSEVHLSRQIDQTPPHGSPIRQNTASSIAVNGSGRDAANTGAPDWQTF